MKPTEHDAYLWADRSEQDRVSSATQAVLDTWRAEQPDRLAIPEQALAVLPGRHSQGLVRTGAGTTPRARGS